MDKNLVNLANYKSDVRAKGIPVRDYYDEKTKKIVYEKYAFEFKNFQYSFEDLP